MRNVIRDTKKNEKKSHAKRKLHAFSATVVLQVMCGPTGDGRGPEGTGNPGTRLCGVSYYVKS